MSTQTQSQGSSCLTSRLGAARYVNEVLIPRLQDAKIEIRPFSERSFNLPELVEQIIRLNAVPVLIEKEFPPNCRKNIEPCILKVAERKNEALWKDAFAEVMRTLLTAKLYIDAQNEDEIAKKMAAIQRLAKTIELFFDENRIYDFLGGVREALGSIARYTKDAELVFAAACSFEHDTTPDIDEVIELSVKERIAELRKLFGNSHQEEFRRSIQKIQSINPN